jgi:hypothetical protein
MSAPLSAVQYSPRQTPGMFGGPRGRITPDGAYTATGTGDPKYGYRGDGWYWNQYPNVISGINGYAAPSTQTGMPLGSPDPEDGTGKVGGGAAQAEIPAYGGTAAY